MFFRILLTLHEMTRHTYILNICQGMGKIDFSGPMLMFPIRSNARFDIQQYREL